MECDICMIEWDFTTRIPRLLSCGHTFCESCLLSLLDKATKANKAIFCPNCMSSQKEITKIEDIKKLIKNFNLLRIVEKIESRKTVSSGYSYTTKRYDLQNIQTKEKKKLIRDEITRNDAERMSKENICKKHSLPVHSYAVGTNLLFCDVCEKETSLKSYPLPNVIKELKRKCDYNQVKICLLRNEIERMKDFFDSYQDEFEKSNKEKIEEIFQYLNKIILYNYNTSMDILQQCKLEQKSQINEKLKELDQLELELDTLEKEMIDLTELDDRELIKQTDNIHKLQFKMNNYINYDLELNLLSMNTGIKSEVKEKLFSTIQDSFTVDVDFMKINGDFPSIKHILQKEKYWGCICGEMNNSIKEIKCLTCGNFRRLETFDKLFTDPLNIPKEEINLINLKRKTEAKEFQEKLKIITQDSNGKFNYFALDLEWFLQWKSFVMNDLNEKILPNTKKKFSKNKEIGVISPGPILNGFLFEKNEDSRKERVLRKGLKKNEDYVVVNENVWKMFFYNYNGGPEIVLDKNDDIFTSVVSISRLDYQPYQFIKDLLNCDNFITSDSVSNDNTIDDKEKCNKYIYFHI